MPAAWVIAAVSFAYLGLLFAIAAYAERRAVGGRSLIANPTVYALSLAVYCTTWTFYGSVGRAAGTGLGFLPTYLGPTLMATLWWFSLRKIIRISKAYRITSIADFVASRYGKSHLLGGLVTLIAVIGIVPYISLQLKAVSASFTMLLRYPELRIGAGGLPLWQDSALYIALIMAGFTILFGTRHLDVSERHEGMVAAIAFESLVKLLAFLAVGIFITFGVHGGFAELFARADALPALHALLQVKPGGASYANWLADTLLAMFAVMLLPRQFQIAVVENTNEQHVPRAAWLFPLYLLLINIFVLPIALSGLLHYPAGGSDPDFFVLTLPMAQHQPALTLLVFIGGLSAATGMLVVETIALSTMICNDLLMPLLLRMKWLQLDQRHDLSGLLLAIRRWAIVAILLLGYLYFRAAGEAYALVAIGLISFAAVAQFAPAIFGGLAWKHGTRNGALAGLLAGFTVWAYTLLLPSFARSGWLPHGFIDAGPFGIALLKPQQLFGLTGLVPSAHGLFWSMLANIGAYIGFSLASRPDAAETRQAALFVDALRRAEGAPAWRGSAEVADLLTLTGRFLGPERARDAFLDYARRLGLDAIAQLRADAALVHHAETLLAGAIGAASARVMVESVTQEEPPGLDEVMNILDEASQVRAYSLQLEHKSRQLEAATAELRAANQRLQELDRMKDDFVSTVTHELRTPLTSIRAFAEILLDDPKIDLAQRRHFLGILAKEAERLTRLINQVLDLAKLESGKAEWHTAELDMLALIREAEEATSQLMRERGVRLELDLPETAPTVMSDHDRLMQVMINLLSNAVKFCDSAAPQVTIRLRHEPGRLRIDVRDNGPGIAAADRERIFEKFRQAGPATSNTPGTGLGLPISRQIIERFGGRLWVESSPGQGATFSFTLPLAEVKADEAVTPNQRD